MKNWIGFVLLVLPVLAIAQNKNDDKGDNAEFVKVEIPSKLRPKERVEVKITIKNTGQTTWRRTEHYYALGCGEFPRYKRNPPSVQIVDQDNPPPSDDHNRLMLDPEETIKPGQTKVFKGTIQAPAKIGTYVMIWQMVIEGGKAEGWPDGWFGTVYPVKIVVEGQPVEQKPMRNDAIIKPREAKLTLKPQEQKDYEIEVHNTGTTTWTTDGKYYLNLRFDKDERAFLSEKDIKDFHLIVSKETAPKTVWKATLKLKAPKTNGSYTITGQMEKKGEGGGFGDYIDLTIVVK